MSVLDTKAASVAAPVAAADPAGRRGVYRYSSSLSSQSIALPDTSGVKHALRGNFVHVTSVGCNTQVAFSVGPQTLVFNQSSTIGTGHVAAGETVFANCRERRLVPRDATHVNFISDAAGYYVEFAIAELLDHAY